MSGFAYRLAVVLAAVALGGLAPSTARAQLVGLGSTGDRLFLLTEAPKAFKVEKTVKLKVKASDPILAMDVRAADGALYGVSAKANVYKINPKNGKVQKQFSLGADLTGVISMDCNAMVDACRIVGDKGLNARFTFSSRTLIVDPELSYASGQGKPRVVAIAYTNSFVGTTSTELFDIDAASDRFYEQDPPNSGVLNAIAKMRPKVEAPVAFDIVSFRPGENVGVIVFRKTVHTFDFSTGLVGDGKPIKGLKVNLRDVAVVLNMR